MRKLMRVALRLAKSSKERALFLAIWKERARQDALYRRQREVMDARNTKFYVMYGDTRQTIHAESWAAAVMELIGREPGLTETCIYVSLKGFRADAVCVSGKMVDLFLGKLKLEDWNKGGSENE